MGLLRTSKGVEYHATLEALACAMGTPDKIQTWGFEGYPLCQIAADAPGEHASIVIPVAQSVALAALRKVGWVVKAREHARALPRDAGAMYAEVLLPKVVPDEAQEESPVFTPPKITRVRRTRSAA